MLAATTAAGSFKAAGDSLRKAASAAWDTLASAAKGTGQAFQQADKHVANEISRKHGKVGEAIAGIAKSKPLYATAAGVGLVGAGLYGVSKVGDHWRRREEARRQESSERER